MQCSVEVTTSDREFDTDPPCHEINVAVLPSPERNDWDNRSLADRGPFRAQRCACVLGLVTSRVLSPRMFCFNLKAQPLSSRRSSSDRDEMLRSAGLWRPPHCQSHQIDVRTATGVQSQSPERRQPPITAPLGRIYSQARQDVATVGTYATLTPWRNRPADRRNGHSLILQLAWPIRPQQSIC